MVIKQKYILLVLNCYKYAHKAKKQKEGWLKILENNNLDIVYFHVIGDSSKCGNLEYMFDNKNKVLYTNSKDDYLSLPHKVITAFKAINETFDYEYIFKTDDDQLLVNENFFPCIVNELGKNKYHYGGYDVVIKDQYSNYYTSHSELPENIFLKGTNYCNGRFYILSNTSINYLVNNKFDIIKKDIIEDHSIGLNLDENLKKHFLNIENYKYFVDIPIYTKPSDELLYEIDIQDLISLVKTSKDILEKRLKIPEIPEMPEKINGKYPIWQCWTGHNEIPEYLKLCNETVKKYNEKIFSVILITPSNINDFVKKDFPLHPAYKYLSYVHKSDYLRCYLIHHYGGLYLDIDTICFNPLTSLFEKLEDYEIIGYDGSKWGEIWGVGCMGPNKPYTEYTEKWFKQLNSILDKRLEDLKKFRKNNKNLNKDCLEWTEILGSIIIPLSKTYDKRKYHILKVDWQPIDEKNIIKPSENFDKELSLLSDVLILNNSLYPEYIKNSNLETIKNNENNILLFKLINHSLYNNSK